MGDELVALGGAFLAAGHPRPRSAGASACRRSRSSCSRASSSVRTRPGIALVDDPHDLELLAALGLIMLLFHLGLEFSLGDLLAGGRRCSRSARSTSLLNVGGGLAFGFALGWGTREALVIAGAVGISSSAIVTKLLTELHRLANPESRLILGIIVVEDVFLALYLALLQPVLGDAHGAGEAIGQFARRVRVPARMLASLARWGPRFVGRLVDTPDDELLTVVLRRPRGARPPAWPRSSASPTRSARS